MKFVDKNAFLSFRFFFHHETRFQSVDIVCYLCLSHSDHNVVSTSLETLEILLKYSNLFELDRIFISTNSTDSAEETRVSQHLKTGKNFVMIFDLRNFSRSAIPNYQRSFIDPQDEQQLVNPSPIHEQSDWDSAITRPKRTSAAKLIEQLISKCVEKISTDEKLFSSFSQRLDTF